MSGSAGHSAPHLYTVAPAEVPLPDPEEALRTHPVPACPATSREAEAQVRELLALGTGPAALREEQVVERLTRQGPAAITPLLAVAAQARPDQLRIVLQVLGRLGHPCAVPLLRSITVLGEPEPARRAAEALVAIGHPAGLRSAALLAAQLGIPLRRRIVYRLAEQGVARAELQGEILSLLRWLTRPVQSPAIRTAACEGLRRFEEPSLPGVLAALLARDADPLVRSCAAQGLVGRVRPAHVPALARALNDEHPPVAAAAAVALGQSGLPEAAPPVLAVLEDGRRPALEPAIRAAVQLGDPRAAPLLLPLLEHRDFYIQAATAEALGRLGRAEEAGGPLLVQLHHPRTAVRLAVVRALGALKHQAALPDLQQLTRQDPEPAVRRAAQEAIRLLEQP